MKSKLKAVDRKMSEYDLKDSTRMIGQLYPVLLANDGSVLDGRHRLDENKNWRKIKLSHIKTETEKLTARIVANMCRRDISRSEKEECVTKLAEQLKKEGIEEGKIAKRISDLTGMTQKWVWSYLPQKLKMEEKVKAGKVSANRRLAEIDVVREVEDTFQDVVDYQKKDCFNG